MTKIRYDHLLTSRETWKKNAKQSKAKLRNARRLIKKQKSKEKQYQIDSIASQKENRELRIELDKKNENLKP